MKIIVKRNEKLPHYTKDLKADNRSVKVYVHKIGQTISVVSFLGELQTYDLHIIVEVLRKKNGSIIETQNIRKWVSESYEKDGGLYDRGFYADVKEDVEVDTFSFDFKVKEDMEEYILTQVTKAKAKWGKSYADLNIENLEVEVISNF